MKLSKSLVIFKKIHKKKINQTIFFSQKCKDYNFVENLYKFYKGGASLVSFSGGKGVRGPQNTGFMIGKKEYVQFVVKQVIISVLVLKYR